MRPDVLIRLCLIAAAVLPWYAAATGLALYLALAA